VSDDAEARSLFASARLAHLATAGVGGQPHVVAICFALEGDDLVTAIDFKPKRTQRLKRLDNIRLNARVSVLVDHYDDDDWSTLWWARADGRARVVEPDDPGHAAAVALLTRRYVQYRSNPPQGPVIDVVIDRWSSWRADRS
jgi:PPOX class probable F420-dependent enzyme